MGEQKIDWNSPPIFLTIYLYFSFFLSSLIRIYLLRKLIKHSKSDDASEVFQCNLEYFMPYLDDTTAIERLLQSDQELNVNDGFGNSSYYKPIHLAAELGKENKNE